MAEPAQERGAAWAELLKGTNCPLCAPQPAANEYKLFSATLRISSLYLAREQRFRGYCYLVFDPYHATNLVELPQHEYDVFMYDVRQAGAALRDALQPDHMNYELLGNSGPHLHWHLFPRYISDPRWGQSVWEGWQPKEFGRHRATLNEQEYGDMITRIRERLPQHYHA